MRPEAMLSAPPGTNWEFDGFTVLTDKRLLLSGGAPVVLTSKAFDTLVVLIANRERVVTKDELLRAVWSDVVVEEGNLTQQVFLLRKALGENAQQSRYILTVPGHGYRFAGNVTETGRDALTPEAARPAADVTIGRRTLDRKLVAAGLAAAGLLAVLAIVLTRRETTVQRSGTALNLTSARITKITENGKATSVALSPDGRYVAYSENDGDQYSLWVKQTATGGKTMVVPRQELVLSNLTFSPDGGFLYFTRGGPSLGGDELLRIPTIGGTETPILDNVETAVSFSPDGRQIAFMRGGEGTTQVVIAPAAGGPERILASRQAPLTFLFVAPDWSPDGKTVAATANDRREGWRSSIMLLPVDGGNSRELYATDSRIGRVRWQPDGSGLLTVISETMARQFPTWQAGLFVHLSGGAVWRIAYPVGRAERLTSDLADLDLCCLDVARNGDAIASVVNTLVSDLYIAPADHVDQPKQLTAGSPVLTRHAWLPDNDTVVYRDLSGSLNGVHKDGRAYKLPLPEGRRATGGLSVCGDGRHVVFQAAPGHNLWRVGANTGGPVQITTGGADANPACFPDGKWVVYSSTRLNVPSLWRVSIDGGEPTRLVAGQSFDALPSPSGRLLYRSTFERDRRGVRLLRWIVTSSVDQKRVAWVTLPGNATMGILPVWAPDESGLDYIATQGGVSNVWRQPLSGGPPVPITHFNSGRLFGLAWSRDGRWLSLASGVNRSDVVVMSNER